MTYFFGPALTSTSAFGVCVPFAGAGGSGGTIGLNYSCIGCGGAGDGAGLTRTEWYLQFYGETDGDGSTEHAQIQVAAHFFAINATAVPITGNLCGTFAGTAQDLSGNIVTKDGSTKTYLETRLFVVPGVVAPSTTSTLSPNTITYALEARFCLHSLPMWQGPFFMANVVCVPVADRYLTDTAPLQSLSVVGSVRNMRVTPILST